MKDWETVLSEWRKVNFSLKVKVISLSNLREVQLTSRRGHAEMEKG